MIIRNARIVAAAEVVTGSLHVVDGCIAGMDSGACAAAAAEDWDGDWLLPGLVELHTDNLEKHLSPRPGVRWPALPAVLAHDAQLAAAGPEWWVVPERLGLQAAVELAGEPVLMP